MNELLSTFEFDDNYFEFVLFLIEKTAEEQLWEVWVNKDIEDSFDTFKKKSLKRGKPKSKALTQEEEDRIMKQAEDILNMVSEEQIS